jgi:hypothetical protein
MRNNKALLEYILDDYIVSQWKQCERRGIHRHCLHPADL